jgi:hypothetical protein
VTAAVLGALLAAGGGAPTQAAGERSAPSLRLLFNLSLQYRPDMPPAASTEGRSGRLLGSGDVRAEGVRLGGDVRWSIFELTGRDRCEVELAGVIQTRDGARIEFDARGFGLVPDPRQPDHWQMNAAVRFNAAADGPYRWTNSLLADWSGSFDMATGRHLYGVYAPRGAGN